MSREGWSLGVALGQTAAELQKKYTLPEAEQILNRRRCAREGHFYDVLTTMNRNEPVQVVCGTCGMTWPIEARLNAANEQEAR